MPSEYALETDYLLDRMPAVERATFQARLIEDAETFERVREAENELYDAFVRGDLPLEWRSRFEQRLLSTPEGRQRLAIARKLKEKTSRRGFAWWIGGAVAAGIAALLSLVPWQVRKPAPVERAAVEQVATFRLRAVTRGETGIPRFSVPAGATSVELEAPVTGAADDGDLKTSNGSPVWRGGPTVADGFARIRVAKDKLPAGPYLLTITDRGNPVAYYEFVIE